MPAQCAHPAETECRMALDQIEQELTGEVPWRTCAVCHHMSDRGDEWSMRLRRLLSNRGIKFAELASSLARDPDEPDIPSVALSRHARGICSAGERLR